MAETKNDGGPAFPKQPVQRISGAEIALEQGGMSLRDWFAGQALAGMADAMMKSGHEQLHSPDVVFNGIASASYRLADAMLAERSK